MVLRHAEAAQTAVRCQRADQWRIWGQTARSGEAAEGVVGQDAQGPQRPVSIPGALDCEVLGGAHRVAPVLMSRELKARLSSS